MDQNKCVALLTAIDLGNLTRAAEQLGYTQSGLSYVIKTLETELGFPLLVRSRTGVRPTEDCQRILPLLRDLDRKSRQLEQEAADIRGLAVGTVSLATFPSISRFWLPEILRDFAQHYPGITVSIRESGQEELDEWLREGSVDLAFCSYHENSQNHWIPFLEDEIWAVVPNGHPLAGCEELSLAQLASEPFILEDRAYDYDISRVIQEAGVHPNVRWTSKDELAILAMVRLASRLCPLSTPMRTTRASPSAPWFPGPTGSWAPPCPIWTVSPPPPAGFSFAPKRPWGLRAEPCLFP